MDDKTTVDYGHEELQKKYTDLTELAKKVLLEHKELKTEYDEIKKKNEDLERKLLAREQELSEITKTLEPAYEEFTRVNEKLEIETQCRLEAENYASTVVSDNQKLKRQSQALMQMMMGNGDAEISVEKLGKLTEEDGELNTATPSDRLKEEVEKYKEEVTDLKVNIDKERKEKEDAILKAEQLKEQLQNEMKKATTLQHRIDQNSNQFKRFQRVSMAVIDEYKEIQGKLDQERTLRQEAEKFASQEHAVKQAVIRESQIAIAEASADEKLRDAFMKIEQLEKEIGEEQQKAQQRILELEMELEQNSKDSLQADLDKSNEIVKILEAEQKDLKLNNDKLLKEVQKLTDELDVANQRLKPPPPPPPPGPPPTLTIFNKILFKKKKTGDQKGNASKGGTSGNPPQMQAAIDEMMARIKSGKGIGLKSVSARTMSVSTPKTETGAFNEMQMMLRKMKRSQSLDDLDNDAQNKLPNNDSPRDDRDVFTDEKTQ